MLQWSHQVAEVRNMRYLSDQMLVDVYHRAIDLRLEEAFIELLHQELQRRNLFVAEVSA